MATTSTTAGCTTGNRRPERLELVDHCVSVNIPELHSSLCTGNQQFVEIGVWMQHRRYGKLVVKLNFSVQFCSRVLVFLFKHPLFFIFTFCHRVPQSQAIVIAQGCDIGSEDNDLKYAESPFAAHARYLR